MPIEISPSLKLTLLPPNALIRDDTGNPMKENTDLPAFDTCPKALKDKLQRTAMSIFLLIATLPHFKIDCKGTTKIAYMQVFALFYLRISKKNSNFAAQNMRDTHK